MIPERGHRGFHQEPTGKVLTIRQHAPVERIMVMDEIENGMRFGCRN